MRVLLFLAFRMSIKILESACKYPQENYMVEITLKAIAKDGRRADLLSFHSINLVFPSTFRSLIFLSDVL